MTSQNKPPSPLLRMVSLMKTGPRALILRFYDQGRRKLTGSPVWNLSRITPNLYIGGQHSDIKGLEAEGITAVVNMRESRHSDVNKGIGGQFHLHLATRDNTPPTIQDLERAADFIGGHIENGQKVYVHCAVGVGRAPSAAAAYLIKYEHLTPADAIQLIRQSRPFVHLTSKQFQQLSVYEQYLNEQRELTESLAAERELKQEIDSLKESAHKLRQDSAQPDQVIVSEQLEQDAESLEKVVESQLKQHESALEHLEQEAKKPIITAESGDES